MTDKIDYVPLVHDIHDRVAKEQYYKGHNQGQIDAINNIVSTYRERLLAEYGQRLHEDSLLLKVANEIKEKI